MMYKLTTYILVICICAVSSQNQPKVHIGVYYESLCRDSYNFITNQLGVVYDTIEDYVDILFVPFGKSESVDGGESFICQHGEPECQVNKIQSCALHLLNKNQRLQTEFVVCQMNDASDKTGQFCSELVGLNFGDVQNCLNDDLATTLQLEAEIKTNRIRKPLSFVPTIVYNNRFDQDLQDRTIKDFLNVVCEQLIRLDSNRIPDACRNLLPKVHVGVYYESLCRDSYNFITNQLGVVYDTIEDYVEILFVPFGKSESVGGGESFICQHGEPECEGNKIQSCALHLLNKNQRLQTEFVVCQMNDASDKTGQFCSELVGLNFGDVQNCLNSDLATTLQLEAEILTNSIRKPLLFVPTIVYNNKFDQDLQDQTIKDFLNVVCEQLIKLDPNRIPSSCRDLFPKVHVGVYYESLCPYSTLFIVNQIGVVYDYVADYVDFLYVPFGKSESENGGESFICQHGEAECQGNKIQSCTLNLLNGNQRLQTDYVICQMDFDSDKTGQICSEHVGLNFDDVEECLNTDKAKLLQLEAEILTNKIRKPLLAVPTIIYNNVFDQELQDRTIRDLLSVLCEQLIKLASTKIPTECTDPY